MKSRRDVLRHYVADIIHNTTNMDDVFDYSKFVEDVNAEHYGEYDSVLAVFDIAIASQLYTSVIEKQHKLTESLNSRFGMLSADFAGISRLAEPSANIAKILADNGGKDLLIQVDANGNVEALTYREVADAGVYSI